MVKPIITMKSILCSGPLKTFLIIYYNSHDKKPMHVQIVIIIKDLKDSKN